ncbi:uncharacterized protein LMH87_009230 [Akanthomyces muscarius]|uniref:Mucoidy inhibitor A n=1 Tax=Akanthomyces muscarius TaxID=2231603 RepID=A0A9W8QHV3_AKAMU|nr:uncharacterized protein LMH87_009230 [Akanthomyces muscarius]KAJ4158716.1 hypothetical protein LMH87_009230 [Akanthomyces muscarius]
MESANEIDYKIVDVPTRAVVLFPGRAQVFRDIKDIKLRPGINEVTISGLSPTLDEDSVKVEGAGSAVITDISVEALPNQNNFEDVYPNEASSDEEESEKEDSDSEELHTAQLRVTELQDEMRLITDTIDSVAKRQTIMDVRSEAMDKMEQDKGARLSELLAAYRSERAALCQERLDAVKSQRNLRKSLDTAQAHLKYLQKAALKESRERRNGKRRQREREQRRRAGRREEQERIRREQIRFWPKYCYSVKVTLDVNTMTPMSSRRASVASESGLVQAIGVSAGTTTAGGADDEVFQDCISCSLFLSYVTSAAKWTPSYDLQLSTTGATATLCFDAKVSNQTSETWSNCRVSLCTSDATVAGVDSDLPELTPWRIRLVGKSSYAYQDSEELITRSRTEVHEYRSHVLAQKKRIVEKKPREEMFGLVSRHDPASVDFDLDFDFWDQAAAGEGRDDTSEAAPVVDAIRCASVGLVKRKKKLTTSAPMPMAALAAPAAVAAPYGASDPYAEPDTVDFEDSLIEEAGMTTSYDLPGLKTLAPKSTESKQRVARITFGSVTLSHSVVAKYRPVAYLQAKLKNNSKLTLLRGLAGLTLDGSFMGRTAIPRCSAGDIFTLNLGVDPAIQVSYAKPDVRRATTGLFSKENSSVFARAVVLHNTRLTAAGKPAQLHVLDQVPVSEDEKLRVEVVTPRGLSLEGSVVAGAPGREEDNRDREWGKATAQLKKGGEVSWDVRLNAGKMVKLWLEYAVSAPSGDVAVEC